jgi:hypothetical protein
MRRSICSCTPSYATAGQLGTWSFSYSCSTNLPKGAKFKFDLCSKGRFIDWQTPETNLKSTEGVIYGLIGKDKIIPAKEIENDSSVVPFYEFTLPATLEAGQTFTIVIGAQPKDMNSKKKIGIQAQTVAQRRRSFLLYIDPSGKGRYGEEEVFSMDVRGDQLHNIRILGPSFVMKNKRFDVVVRFEDEYGNLTNLAPEDTLITLSHEHLRENLNWKLFVPETGFIALPNLYFNEVGTYTIKLHNSKTNEFFYSAPIYCSAETGKNLFWGLLHGESDRFDSTENIESCLRHFRDDKALYFYGSSPFENQEETSQEEWKLISQNIADLNEEDRFTTFLGFQWVGEPKNEGCRLFVYAKDNKLLLRKKEAKTNTLSKIYRSSLPKELISIPTFTMGKGFDYDFKNFDPQFERVVEIYNAWGSSENTKKEGNPVPITADNDGVEESAEGSIQKALNKNYRFGFVAGGLDDRGIYSDFYDQEQEQYLPGLTAIIAPHHSRDAMFEALYQRSCYATTGERIIIGFYLAGTPMGQETGNAEKRGLIINRHLSGYVAGTAKIEKIEIIRNGKILATIEPNVASYDFTYDDMTPLDKVVINAKDGNLSFAYYYIKVFQEDGHIAWSSPIWVDFTPPSQLPKPVPKATSTAVASKASLDLFDEDEEEEEEEEEEEFEDDTIEE